MELNNDFLDFFEALNYYKVEYIVVGGYAVGFYGYSRYTSDLDVFVNPTTENINKLFQAFEKFGAPTSSMDKNVFLRKPTKENPCPGVSFGREPIRLEIISAINEIDFAEAWKSKEIKQVKGLNINVLNLDDLIKNKKSTARTKDILDIEELEKRRKEK